jgi:hypothetical protein
MGFKASTFGILVLSNIIVFVITISIHILLCLFVFVPFLGIVSYVGAKIKAEQAKGRDNYLKSLMIQKSLPQVIPNNYSINQLLLLRK